MINEGKLEKALYNLGRFVEDNDVKEMKRKIEYNPDIVNIKENLSHMFVSLGHDKIGIFNTDKDGSITLATYKKRGDVFTKIGTQTIWAPDKTEYMSFKTSERDGKMMPIGTAVFPSIESYLNDGWKIQSSVATSDGEVQYILIKESE